MKYFGDVVNVSKIRKVESRKKRWQTHFWKVTFMLQMTFYKHFRLSF
jgi:hypothetical protein